MLGILEFYTSSKEIRLVLASHCEGHVMLIPLRQVSGDRHSIHNNAHSAQGTNTRHCKQRITEMGLSVDHNCYPYLYSQKRGVGRQDGLFWQYYLHRKVLYNSAHPEISDPIPLIAPRCYIHGIRRWYFF